MVTSILRNYSRASGQLMNLAKSVIFFSSNVLSNFKQKICSSLNIYNMEVHDQF